MFTPERRSGRRLPIAVLAMLAINGLTSAAAAGPDLGREMNAAQVATIARTIYPDGTGLPQGTGSVGRGATIYAERCAGCHGPAGRGASAEELVGGEMPLDSEWADKTVGSYWPYATTLFDFIDRAMPMDAPRSLSADDVYAVCAYLLHLNGILGAEAVLDAARLARIEMPNRHGFIGIDAPAGD